MSREYRVKVIRGTWEGYNRCSLGISVGGHFHEGNKFLSTMNWVSQQFSSCHVFICDALQRFNQLAYYKEDYESALVQAVEAGEQWLLKNRTTINECSCSEVTISRWEDWLAHPKVEGRIQQMSILYKEHCDFRSKLNADVHRYLKNNWEILQEDGVPYEKRHEGGIEYMIEELAVLGLIAEEVSPVEIYAGPESQGASIIRELQIQDAPQGLKERLSVKIDFRSKS